MEVEKVLNQQVPITISQFLFLYLVTAFLVLILGGLFFSPFFVLGPGRGGKGGGGVRKVQGNVNR